MLLFFLFSFLFSQEELPTIQIYDESAKINSTRSVHWPTQVQKTNPTILLPQIEDTINSSNGLQSRTQGSPTFSIRGSAQSGRVLVMYDQIPLNFSSALGVPRIFLPKETIENLVVIKGPASLFYGSQAMAGAIDFVSKIYDRPEFVMNFSDTNESFLPGRGEGGLAHQSYQLASPIYKDGDNFLQISAFYEDDDGRFPFQNEQISGVRDFNASNMSRVSIKGAQQSSSWRIDYNALIGKHIQQSHGPTTFPIIARQESDGVLASVSPHFFINDLQSIKSRLTYISDNSEFTQTGLNTLVDRKTLSLQNEWIYEFSPHTKMQFFLDNFSHQLDNSLIGENLTQDNLEFGPFFSFQSLNNLKHQVGGRYLFRSKLFLPSLSTQYNFQRQQVWLSYSEGFRNPTLSDLFANSPFFVGNPNLNAEISKQVELGIKTQEPSTLEWDVRIFHMQYRNFIEYFENAGVGTKQNGGRGFSRGFDGEIHLKQKLYSLGLIYNFLETKSRQQQRAFRLSPRHQITLQGALQLKNVSLQMQNTHWYKTIDVFANQPVELEDWQQWNFFMFFKVSSSTHIQLGLVNAFNEGKQLTLNYPEPQRKYWLQIKQLF